MGTTISLGARLRLLDIFEGEVKWNMGSLGQGGPGYQTYWGGYGIGDYACIGEVNTQYNPLAYELSLQTPTLFSNNSEEGLRLFASYIKDDFKLYYHSGYHMYGEAFYKNADYFKIGDFTNEGLRYGIKIAGLMEDKEIALKLFYQRNEIKSDLTERAKDFKVRSTEDIVGFGLEVMF